MAKRAPDTSPDCPPSRQPHAVIVALMRGEPAHAFTPGEILGAVCSRLPSWRAHAEMRVTQQRAVSAALRDLLGAGLVAEVSGSGGEPRYHAHRRAAPGRVG